MDLLEKRTLEDFDKEALNLLGYFELQSSRSKINGSSQYKHLLYRSDYDVMTVVSRSTPPQQLFEELTNAIQKIDQGRETYFTELKLETKGGEKYRTFPGESLSQDTLTRHYADLAFVKLDMVMLVKNRFYEASCVYRFQAEASLTTQDVIADMDAEVRTFLREKNYYKALKRLYSLAVLRNSRAEIESLTRVFNSELGREYERFCNLKAMELVHEHYKDKSTLERMRTNLRLLGESFQLRSLGGQIRRSQRKLSAEAKPIYQELYGRGSQLSGGAKKGVERVDDSEDETQFESEEARDELIRKVVAKVGSASAANILREARLLIVADLEEDVGRRRAEILARVLTLRHVQDWLKKHEEQPPEAPEGAVVKDQIIEEAFNRYTNFGNVAKTLADAKKVDKKITRKDVQEWKDKNYIPLKNQRGVNSYVAKKPREEYQIDLMFFDDLREKDAKTKVKAKAKYAGALLVVDIFTKYCHVEPITDKTDVTIRDALKKSIEKMGSKPKSVYHDAEAAFTSEVIQQYFAKHKILSITTLSHAPVAERTIRTIKGLLYPRVKHFGDKWWDEMPHVLDVYNKVDKHRSTGLTPEQAEKPENKDDVRLELELNRRRERKYPPVAVGDKIRIYKKKDKGEKENVAPWTDKTWKVTWSGNKKGVKIFNVDDKDKPLPAKKEWLMRHEIFRVPN